jgi:hypothetical protein
MKISLLLPTRNNFENLQTTIDSFLENASDVNNVEILIAIDFDEPFKSEIYDKYGGALNTIIVEFPIRHGYLGLQLYMEGMILKSSGEYVWFLNDDVVVQTKGWDLILQNHSGFFHVIEAKCKYINRDNECNISEWMVFPIVPRLWVDVVGRVSTTGCLDAWISEVLEYVKEGGISIFYDEHNILLEHDHNLKYAGVKNGNPINAVLKSEFEKYKCGENGTRSHAQLILNYLEINKSKI